MSRKSGIPELWTRLSRCAFIPPRRFARSRGKRLLLMKQHAAKLRREAFIVNQAALAHNRRNSRIKIIQDRLGIPKENRRPVMVADTEATFNAYREAVLAQTKLRQL